MKRRKGFIWLKIWHQDKLWGSLQNGFSELGYGRLSHYGPCHAVGYLPQEASTVRGIPPEQTILECWD